MKKSISTSILLLLMASMALSYSLVYAPVSQPSPNVTLLWTNQMEVLDVAVAGNGLYLAAVNASPSGLYFFASDNSNPVWWWLDTADIPLSVAISSDGNEVAVGTSTGYVYYFGNSLYRSGLQASQTWRSRDLGGPIERRAIDISDSGQYVVVGGTGDEVYYFADCGARSGFNEDVTWHDFPAQCNEIFAVDLSPDGQTIAAGGSKFGPGLGGFVAYYAQANTPPFPKNEIWNARSSIDGMIMDIKLSDDGYAVAAVSGQILPSTLHYWRNAAMLTGDPQDTWNSTLPYACVDMSSDGNEAVAGKPQFGACGIHFWADALSLTGIDMAETWSRHEGEHVPDVAINNEGSILAGVAVRYNAQEEYFAYFYTADGNSIGEFQFDSLCDKISMSRTGETVAVGGALQNSLHVFKVLIAEPVGGTIVADYLPVLTPFLVCGAAVTMGLLALAKTRRRL